ncbi:MarR family winged helix-turn-helix transcriptional regulator [Chloroflexota bacterium]
MEVSAQNNKIVAALNELPADHQPYNLWRLFSKVRRAIWKSSERELARHDITPEQAGILYIIRNVLHNPSQSDISRQMLIEHHTISGSLKRMEAKGLVKRKTDVKRKSVIRISLTPKGEAACELAVDRRSINNVMNVLSLEEREQFVILLQKLLEKSLEELNQHYSSPFSIPHKIAK